MSEEKELKSFSNGEYVLEETENSNQFYLYRQDGQELGEVGMIAMDMYKNYVFMKRFEGRTTKMVANHIKFTPSDDGKCIRLTTSVFGEKDPLEVQQEAKGIKKLVKSLFGNPRK